jgi:MFS transporter, DHA2 family, multidrug resistance protein
VAIYRSGIAEGIPADLPATAASIARDTLGGAVQVASQLPDRLGAPLLEAAQDSFIQGIHVSALISLIGALGLAAFTAISLRRRGVGAEPMPEDGDEDSVPSEAA